MSSDYRQYITALGKISSPTLFLDLDAFESNVRWVIGSAGNKKIRVATKSIRSTAVLKKILSFSPVFQGLMTFDLKESLWLRSLGFKDILLGYPTLDQAALRELARDPSEITLMVDLPEHLDLLESIASETRSHFNICVDLDLSMDLPGLRFGVYRSSLHTEKNLSLFLDRLANCPHLRLIGAMGYEAQIAGVGDKDSTLIKSLKSLSLPQLRKRRKRMVELIKNRGHDLELVNGGGTGSLTETSLEEVVTEITVGSAFFAPLLFDQYESFSLSPALFFALPITRRPERGIITCLGGGYVASGSSEPSKLPLPYLPLGLKILKHEGVGEVQTPFAYEGTEKLDVGDFVIMRHAKAGEPCERFETIHLIRENHKEGEAQTYRGQGKSFL